MNPEWVKAAQGAIADMVVLAECESEEIATAAVGAVLPLIADRLEAEADKTVNAGRSTTDPSAYARMAAYDRAARIVRGEP